MSLSASIQTLTHNLSFSTSLTPPQSLLFPKSPRLSHPVATQKPWPAIRMGGGPRTYPGGVSKWQWKRMQDKKAKQLLKARLCRERQIYEMRKRAELRAAASELERPWEPVERAAAPTLFSVSADEQLKVLADRFQRPGGFDMWTEDDGPELFRSPDELPSARFFPKGVVHSVRPYRRVSEGEGLSDSEGNFGELDSEDADVDELGGDRRRFGGRFGAASGNEGLADSESSNSKKLYGFRRNGNGNGRKFESSGSNRSALSDSEGILGESGETRNRNDKRSYEGRFGGRLAGSGENGGSLNSNSSYGLRGNGNSRTYRSFDSNGSDKRFSGKHGVLGQQRNGNNRRPYGRKSGGQSGSFSEGENENGGLLGSKSSNSENYLEPKSGSFRRKGNGRSFGPSNLRNGYSSSNSGFDRKQRVTRGSNFRRSEGRYNRGNGSRTMSNSESEVYDMSLERDGRYGFQP